MIVEVDFDLWVHAAFAWTGRLPVALMEEIRRQKVEIYQALESNPLEPDILTSEMVFSVDGRRFRAFFGSDQQQSDASSDVRRLRVLWIDEEN